MPRIELGLKAPHACVLPLYDIPPFCDVLGRAAGNRTRSLRTRSARTTGILRPDEVLDYSLRILTEFEKECITKEPRISGALCNFATLVQSSLLDSARMCSPNEA